MSTPAITGVMSRTGFNSLVLTLSDGENPLAIVKQSGENHLGPRMYVSMGLRNGGKGRHRITLADGTKYALHSSKKAPSILIDAKKRTVMTLSSGKQALAVDDEGNPLLTLAPHPTEHMTDERFLLEVSAGGVAVGDLEIYRKTPPAPTKGIARDVLEITGFLTPTANVPKLPLAGVRFAPSTPLADQQRLAVLALSVNLVIGLVPIGEEMTKAYKKLP